ncbi:MAG: C40 family peptidase [Paludibacteraceae bacterium]|nr:C40 family peptidase [Paludibacteraceae bacterium]
MVRAVALHSVVPIRREPSEASEQLTQMLFVETCEVIEEQPNWLLVQLDHDGEKGWADRKMLTLLSEDEYTLLKRGGNAKVVMPWALAVSEGNGQTIPLNAATRLPYYKERVFDVLGATFRIDPSMVINTPLALTADNVMQTVRFFLNIPYLWGGRNAMGMDCSGFVQVLFSLFDISLPRNTSAQALEGEEVLSLEQAQAGDLVFFNHEDIDSSKKRISHVGVLIDKQTVVHCSGRVKVEKIDDKGIFSAERADANHPKGIYTHHLALIRRFKQKQ